MPTRTCLLIEEPDAVEALGMERMEMLRGCVEQAWEAYDTNMRPAMPLATTSAVAHCLHELTLQQVRDSFGPETGVIVHDNTIGGRFLLEVPGKLVVQFKKLTKDFHTSNNPTETSEKFDRQEPIEGFPIVPRLTVGYQLGHYGTAIAGIYLAFVVGRECVWYHDLQDGGSSMVLDFRPNAGRPSPAERERAEERRHDVADDEEADDVG